MDFGTAYMRCDCNSCDRDENICRDENKCLKSTEVTAIVHFIGGTNIRFEFKDKDECTTSLIAPRNNENQWLKVENYYINKSTITFIEVV